MPHIAHNIAQCRHSDRQLLVPPVDVKGTSLESQQAFKETPFGPNLVVPRVFGLVGVVCIGFANGVKTTSFIAFRHRGVYHTEGRKLVFKRKFGRYLPVYPACIEASYLPSVFRVNGIEHGRPIFSHPFYLCRTVI